MSILASGNGGSMTKRSIASEIIEIAKEQNWKLLTISGDTEENLVFKIKDFRDDKVFEIPLKIKVYDLLGATISPNGLKIAFWTRNDRASSDLYIIDTDGKNLNKLVEAKEGGGFVSWSSDNQNIAFVGNLYELSLSFNLYTVNIKSKKIRILIKGGVEYITTQAYSPDMSKIAYVKAVKKNDIIEIYDIEKRVILRQIVGGCPIWSPRDDLIAYLDNNSLKIADLTGNIMKTLVEEKLKSISTPMYWLPNGQFILFGKYDVPNDEIGTPFVVKVENCEICDIKGFFDETWTWINSWSSK